MNSNEQTGSSQTGAAAAEPAIITAERHFSSGDFDEATRICEALCRQNQHRGKALYLLGLIAGRRNRLDDAHELMTEALRLHPAAPRLRHDLVSLCARMGRVDEAEGHLKLLIEYNPQDSGTFEHLALIQQGLGRTDEAIASFRRALEVEPEALGANQALGGMLFQRGALESALDHLRTTRAAKPAGEDRYQMLGLTLLALGLYDELAALDPKTSRTAGQRFNETVLKALLFWQQGDFEACQDRINQAEPFAKVPDSAPNRRVFTTYFNYIQRLLKFRSLNMKLYRDEVAGDVYAIGDSHCMMAGHLSIPIGGASHRVVPRLVFGCKAFHLIAPSPTPYRSAFGATLARLPDGAKVIASLGEIDLRYNEGIMDFLRKMPEADPDRTAASLAQAYLDRLTQLARPKGLELIVMSPPASNVNRGKMPEQDREVFDRIIVRFNEELRRSVAEAGLPLIDLFGATRDENGQTIARHYVDPNHVRPKVFVEAAEAAQL